MAFPLRKRQSQKIVLAFVTVPNRADAVKISKHVIDSRLAACANIIPGVKSIYRWRGCVEEGREFLILFKTTTKGYPALEKAIRKLHGYDVPEIIAVKIETGYIPYLDWVMKEVHN